MNTDVVASVAGAVGQALQAAVPVGRTPTPVAGPQAALTVLASARQGAAVW